MSGEPEAGGGGGDHGGTGGMRWLLTYADLITLLMVFFVVMFAFANLDKDKYAKLARSLQIALGGQGGGSLVVLGTGEGSHVPLPRDLYSRLPPEQQVEPGKAPAVPAQPDPLLQLGHQLAVDLTPYGRFHVYATDRGVVVSLLGSALFVSGKADIRPEAEPVLQTIAARLRDLPNDVSVEGSADDVPISNSVFPSNWELAARRATEVVRYLQGLGLSGRRLYGVSYGDEHPVFDNNTPEGRAANRRVDIVILREVHRVNLGQEIR